MVYGRQKILLTVLKKARGRKVSKLHLVKWLFLLKEEGDLDPQGSFYDFLPYKYGPFSFLLYKEMVDLEKQSLIRVQNHDVVYTELADQYLKPSLPSATMRSIDRVLEEYGEMSQDEIIDYVYTRFPWYASKSELRAAASTEQPNCAMEPAVYTFGYEGLSIDATLDIFLRKHLKNIIDVRSNSFSRKYGFSSRELKRRCEDLDINYHHFPELGIAALLRSESNREDLWKTYEEKILPRAPHAVEKAADLCRSAPSALLCFEKDPEMCHRRILAQHVSRLTELPVYHYGAVDRTWSRA